MFGVSFEDYVFQTGVVDFYCLFLSFLIEERWWVVLLFVLANHPVRTRILHPTKTKNLDDSAVDSIRLSISENLILTIYEDLFMKNITVERMVLLSPANPWFIHENNHL
jgi:hypothetical protein